MPACRRAAHLRAGGGQFPAGRKAVSDYQRGDAPRAHSGRVLAPANPHGQGLGVNTVAVYVFWNYHETAEGRFDFSSGGHDIARFMRICREEGMWVLLRPGPYVCAEWDFGGLPPYLLRIPDLKIRCLDARYMTAVERYLRALAAVVRPLQASEGGPILMVQIENEYGSYGNDRNIWSASAGRGGMRASTCRSTRRTGPPPRCSKRLAARARQWDWIRDPATPSSIWLAAINPGVPVFASEIYPGWLTHWGEKWQRPDTGPN